MKKYCVFLTCKGDFKALDATLNALTNAAYDDIECIFFFEGDAPTRYEIPFELLTKMRTFSVNNINTNFINIQNLNHLEKIKTYINNSQTEKILFLNEGELINEIYLKYIDNFFEFNPRNCGVVFTSLGHKDERILSSEFQSASDNDVPNNKIPNSGCVDLNDSFPDSLTGAVVLTKDAISIGLDITQGDRALVDMVRRAAERKNFYGRVNGAVVELMPPVCEHRTTDRQFLVSCIIPIYNVEKYLEEAIESVVNQTIGFEENVQLILINDGSSDSSGDICKAYTEKYPDNIYYIEQENRGVSAARNAGLNTAVGEFISFLDADDFWDIDLLKTGVMFLKKYLDVDMVSFPVKFAGGNKDGEQHILNFKFKKEGIIDLNEQPDHLITFIHTHVIRHIAIGELRNPLGWWHFEDISFISDIVRQKQKYGVVTRPYYNYRKRDTGDSASQNELTRPQYFNCLVKLFT